MLKHLLDEIKLFGNFATPLLGGWLKHSAVVAKIVKEILVADGVPSEMADEIIAAAVAAFENFTATPAA